MEIMNDYIVAIVLVGCLGVGYILKHLVPSEKVDKFIPAIVGVLGMFLNVWANGWEVSPTVLVAGLISGLASTGMHQLFKQFIEAKGTVE